MISTGPTMAVLQNYSTPLHHSIIPNALSYIPNLPHQFAAHPPLPNTYQHQFPQSHERPNDPRTPYRYPHPQHPFDGEDRRQHAPHEPLHHQEHDVPPPATPHYTRVNVASGTSANVKTRVHAVIDYDGDYYDEVEDEGGVVNGTPQANQQPVTPIQGPIFLRNGSVPVVPLYSYPQLNNGSFVQIPILWTALSVALGLELKGEYIRGVPCIKRHQQLFCPTAGNTYPIDRIELFIDENKALMKRMYGEFIMVPEYTPGPDTQSARKRKRATGTGNDSSGGRTTPGIPDRHGEPETESLFGNLRGTRQSFKNNQSSESGRVDACESKIEIVTPYWASNSAGKIRAIVNTQHFEQAIHQEVCAKSLTNRCSGDCGCEQKYKWHRLLAYDPDNDCKGIFMDWFLFPSCCVCRCNPI